MRYASIRELDISNGEGVGVSLFVQGCHFHCKNCFNYKTWDFNGGYEWTQKTKDDFLKLIDRPYIKRVSILGGEPLADENLDMVLDLVSEINKRYSSTQDVVQNKNTNHNILNIEPNEIRVSFPKKDIWIYSGFTWEEVMNPIIISDFNPLRDELINKRREIVKMCDVLVDGRYVDSQRDVTLKYRGSSNQRVIDVKKSLEMDDVVLYCD